jgi:hypothetical protein
MWSAQWPPRKQPQASNSQYASSGRAGEQAVRPARVRQASVTSAALTPAERASVRTIAALTRAPDTPRTARTAPSRTAPSRTAPPRTTLPRTTPSRAAPSRTAPSRAAPRPTRDYHAANPGRHRDNRNSAGPPALRRTTGIVLTVAGAILWLGVHTTVAFVATERAGLVLLVTGLVWLWIPVPDKRDRLRRRLSQLVSFIEWDPAATRAAKCSLEDLFAGSSDSAPPTLANEPRLTKLTPDQAESRHE